MTHLKAFEQARDEILGKVFNSNKCGKFKVVEYRASNNVLVEFLKTGYQTVVTKYSVLLGRVRDFKSPTLFGRGYLGSGEYTTLRGEKTEISYSAWRRMFERCYGMRKGKIQWYVHVDFYNFQDFAAWYEKEHARCVKTFGAEGNFRLCTPTSSEGVKMYGPTTSSLQAVSEGVSLESRRYEKPVQITKDGVSTVLYGTQQIKQAGLCPTAISRVANGIRITHKGYTAKFVDNP